MGHAPGFSGVGGGGVPPSDFLRKSWQILEPVAKFWGSSAENSGIFASSDGSFAGAAVTTREKTGSLSCDSAACED